MSEEVRWFLKVAADIEARRPYVLSQNVVKAAADRIRKLEAENERLRGENQNLRDGVARTALEGYLQATLEDQGAGPDS